MKKITIEIPDDKELIYLDGEYKLVDSKEYQLEKDKKEILESIEEDIEALYEKYKDKLIGKYGLKININFIAWRSWYKYKKTEHWVSNESSVDFVEKELDWND